MAGVYLDPFQTIVGVGWGGARIATVEFAVTWSGDADYTDTPLLTGLPFGDNIALLGGGNIKYPGNLHAVNPISADMRAHGYMWSSPLWSRSSSGTTTNESTVIDEAFWAIWLTGAGAPLGGERITYTNGVPDQAALNQMLDAWAAYLGVHTYDLHFEVGQIFRSHTEWQTITTFEYEARIVIFLNMARIAAILSATHRELLQFSILTGPATYKQNYQWAVDVATFKGGRDFPVDLENNPQWSYVPVSQAGRAAPSRPETELWPYVTSFSIAPKTLLVESTSAPTS